MPHAIFVLSSADITDCSSETVIVHGKWKLRILPLEGSPGLSEWVQCIRGRPAGQGQRCGERSGGWSNAASSQLRNAGGL
jgi:hypothetical protein